MRLFGAQLRFKWVRSARKRCAKFYEWTVTRMSQFFNLLFKI